ncbi:unnamed protein product [Rotaria sp. Silwood2]|nr:unnamed protein product [Rotaria sp. Silwood2]
MTDSNKYHEYRKWFGLLWLIIESILLGGNIFGFSALFDILPKYGIYSNLCVNITITNSSNANDEKVTENCEGRTGRYQLFINKEQNNN